MRTAISKISLVALIIAATAMLYSAKSFAWKEYLMDPMNTDVFDEYDVTPSGASLTMTYTGNSYWRQVAPKYRIADQPSGTSYGLYVSPGIPSTSITSGSFTLPFDNASTATLTQAPPIRVPGFVNGSTITQTYTNVNNVTVTSNGTSGTSSGTTGTTGTTVVITGGSSSGTTGTTGATGSGGIIVIPSR